ncbi:MAG: potassium transporter, partial [Lentisphaeria bacterium]|nr:potassium transporter [Lentisphaeria bacterium]
ALVAVAYRSIGMDNWFDAICHSFSTVATGGFGNYTESFGYFKSPALQWAAIIAMFLSGCNFMLMLKLALKGKFEYLKDEEFRTFLFMALAATLIFTLQLHSRPQLALAYTDNSPLPHQWEPLARASAFQVVSIMSTTGFSTSDYLTWQLPGLPMLMLILMLAGGCGGSTSGGIKVARLIVVAKQSLGDAKRKLSPHLMPNVMLNRARVEMPVVRQTMAFVVIYFTTLGICTFLLPYLSEMDFETALSAAISAISNVGPGLAKVGPSATYAWMTPSAKCLLAFTMIAGRLELYTALVVILPSFWHNRH